MAPKVDGFVGFCHHRLVTMSVHTHVYSSLWGPINGMGFGNWFHAKYLRLRLLYHPFALRELYIIRTCSIILHYLLAVLRLLCAHKVF